MRGRGPLSCDTCHVYNYVQVYTQEEKSMKRQDLYREKVEVSGMGGERYILPACTSWWWLWAGGMAFCAAARPCT